MNSVDIKLTKKQTVAWKYLFDNHTNQILFGGGAGSAKTFLGCLFVVTMCLNYAGTRYLIGRSVLTQLRLTTLRTLLEVIRMMGMNDNHFVYNQQTNIIKFYNDSEIILKDLAYNPSDPEYDSLGSLEITSAFIDEGTQIPHKAYSVVRSRLRYKLDEYDLTGKVLVTCNPQSSGWVKSTFYQPFIEDSLPNEINVILANAYDNPHLPKQYIDTLKSLPEQQRKRLLDGDWNYSVSINDIFDYDSISQSVFSNSPNKEDKVYMSVDVARLGSDSTVISIWSGYTVIEIIKYSKYTLDKLHTEISSLMRSYGVHPSNIIIDTDGVGGGLKDFTRARSFVNNSKPLFDENFTNLKSQCYVKLSELFKKGIISININDPIILDDLTNELLSHKYSNIDKDTKIGIISKDEVKKHLGRSPDISDSLMMRMYFELENNKITKKYAVKGL